MRLRQQTNKLSPPILPHPAKSSRDEIWSTRVELRDLCRAGSACRRHWCAKARDGRPSLPYEKRSPRQDPRGNISAAHPFPSRRLAIGLSSSVHARQGAYSGPGKILAFCAAARDTSGLWTRGGCRRVGAAESHDDATENAGFRSSLCGAVLCASLVADECRGRGRVACRVGAEDERGP